MHSGCMGCAEGTSCANGAAELGLEVILYRKAVHAVLVCTDLYRKTRLTILRNIPIKKHHHEEFHSRRRKCIYHPEQRLHLQEEMKQKILVFVIVMTERNMFVHLHCRDDDEKSTNKPEFCSRRNQQLSDSYRGSRSSHI